MPPQKSLPVDTQQQVGSSSSLFTLQLFQRTLEETLDSFQKSIHGDMRNLHIEILRQFHMHEVITLITLLQHLISMLCTLLFAWIDGNVKCYECDFGKSSRADERSEVSAQRESTTEATTITVRDCSY